MKPEEINAAIALELGWKRCRNDGEGNYSIDESGPHWMTPSGGAHCSNRIPSYCEDLNACAEFEQKLKRETGMLSVRCEIRTYWLKLMEIMNPGVKLWDNGTFLGSWNHAIKVSEATAAQKCKAYLRLKGKWRE